MASIEAGLLKKILDNQTVSFDSFNVTITRPANTTVYTAGDVIGDVSGNVVRFTDVAVANSAGVRIDNISAFTNDTGLTGKNIKIHIYSSAPVTPIADNQPMTIDAANYLRRKGVLNLTFGTGIYANMASDLFTNLILNPEDKNIYLQVETDAFTPSANSTTITLKISVTRTN
jgi:hypothetical protein